MAGGGFVVLGDGGNQVGEQVGFDVVGAHGEQLCRVAVLGGVGRDGQEELPWVGQGLQEWGIGVQGVGNGLPARSQVSVAAVEPLGEVAN